MRSAQLEEKVLEPFNNFMAQFRGLSTLFGIAGVGLAIWRYVEELKLRRKLVATTEQLAEAQSYVAQLKKSVWGTR